MMVTKWAIQDYLEDLRWWKNKEKNKSGSLWMIYFLVVLPLIMQVFESADTALSYFCIMIPIFVCIGAQSLQRNLLPKMMYLCPTSQEMRKSYIEKVCLIRIAAPFGVGVVGVTILFCFGICDGITGIGIMLNMAALSISVGVGLFIKSSGKVIKGEIPRPDAGLLEIFILFATMITGLLCASWMSGITTMPWLKWSFVVGEILLLVPLVVSYWKRWPEAVERALKYENR